MGVSYNRGVINHYIVTVLASSQGPEYGKASPWALFLVLVLLIGVFFLIANMNKHLRIITERFGHDRNINTTHNDESEDVTA